MQRYVSKLLQQFRLTQIKYRRPDIWTAMADKTESELDAVEQAVYHDVDKNELSMLFRVSQLGGKTLPIGSFTKRKISQMLQRVTGVMPVAQTLLGSKEILLEFERATSVVKVAMILHALTDLDDLKVQTHSVMARRELLIDMFHEKEESNERNDFYVKKNLSTKVNWGR